VSFLEVDRREVFLELFLDDFLRNFMPPMSNLLFSGFFTPTRVSASHMRLVLMAASKGASVAREGDRFTSINQGLENDELLKIILLEVRIDKDIIAKELKAVAVFLKAKFLKIVDYY
jgi:hypothetical protein